MLFLITQTLSKIRYEDGILHEKKKVSTRAQLRRGKAQWNNFKLVVEVNFKFQSKPSARSIIQSYCLKNHWSKETKAEDSSSIN